MNLLTKGKTSKWLPPKAEETASSRLLFDQCMEAARQTVTAETEARKAAERARDKALDEKDQVQARLDAEKADRARTDLALVTAKKDAEQAIAALTTCERECAELRTQLAALKAEMENGDDDAEMKELVNIKQALGSLSVAVKQAKPPIVQVPPKAKPPTYVATITQRDDLGRARAFKITPEGAA